MGLTHPLRPFNHGNTDSTIACDTGASVISCVMNFSA